jgi:hypothetical protein
VVLEAVDELAVLDDLARAAAAGREDLCAGGEPRHVVVPVAHVEHDEQIDLLRRRGHALPEMNP